MANHHLVLLEVTGIQNYIFGSNHLAQNIGASELVYRSTTEWVKKTLDNMKLEHNYIWDVTQGSDYNSNGVSSMSMIADAEVVYAGGGNAMLIIKESDLAQKFINCITRKVLGEAPGLQLIAIMDNIDLENDIFSEKHFELRRKLAARKMDHPYSVPLVGLGVTAKCVYTGMPAVGWDDDPKVVGKEEVERNKALEKEPRLISAEVASKLRWQIESRKRLEALFPQVRQKGLEFAYDFDDFVSKGESSYIAVIHTDGNKMGERFSQIRKACPTSKDNLQYINKVRALSIAVQRVARDALNMAVDCLLNLDKEKLFLRNQERLPFRPILFGGDDVTFVCEGRLGLSMAAKYLLEFSSCKQNDQKPFTARAGVAIVKSHYPFSRAYRLSEDLAQEAKKAIEERLFDGEENTNILDWHISTTGVIDNLKATREREYISAKNKSMLMRPLRVSTSSDSIKVWQDWSTFRQIIDAFQNDEDWSKKRNKLKALRDALRGEDDVVRLFIQNYGLSALPDIPGQNLMRQYGWQGGKCGYFDALESLDFFIPLDKIKK